MSYKLSLEEIENGFIVTRPVERENQFIGSKVWRETIFDAINECEIALKSLRSEAEKQEKEEKKTQPAKKS